MRRDGPRSILSQRPMRVLRWAALAVALIIPIACGGGPVTDPSDEPTVPPPAPQPPETWIVWGQSNALGCAEGPGYEGSPGVEAWSAGRWVPGSEPLPFMDPHGDCESGWAVAAGNLMGHPVRLTGHAHVAKPVGWWLKDPSRLLSNLQDAREARWMIAYQGESDAERRSTTWASDLARLVSLVREATNRELRVLIIGIGDEPSTSGRNLWNNLREQQRAAAAADPLARFISAEGLEVQDDEVHLTRGGYAALARRVVDALR